MQGVDYSRCCQCHLYSPLDVSSSHRQLDAQFPCVPMVSWPSTCISACLQQCPCWGWASTTNKLTSLETTLNQWRIRVGRSYPNFLLWWGGSWDTLHVTPEKILNTMVSYLLRTLTCLDTSLPFSLHVSWDHLTNKLLVSKHVSHGLLFWRT